MRAVSLIALGVVSVVGLAGSIGCGPLVIPRPTAPEDARGEILLVGDDDGPRAAFASDPALPTTFPRASIEGVERAEIYFVADDLDARGLGPGRIELTGERVETVGADAIELGGDAVWGNGALRWSEDLRLPAVDLLLCLDFGHCFSDRICGSCDLSPPEPPAPPEPPDATCPAGWTRFEDEGFGFCRAFATAPPEACPAGTGRFPGEAECVGVAAACPNDGWPAELPAGAIFVSSSAAAGDGSRARPFPRLQDAITAIEAGGGVIVALDRGTHRVGEITLTGAAALVGACGETIVEGGLDVTGTFALRHLTLVGHVRSNGALAVEDVAVVEPSGAATAIRASSGALRLDAVSVSAPQSEGVRTNEGVSIQANRLYVGPGSAEGVIVQGEASRVTRAFVEGRAGFGIHVLLANAPVIREVAIVRNEGVALRVERSSGVEMGGVWIEDQRGGEAISIVSSARVAIDHASILSSANGDLFVNAANVAAKDLVVVDSGPDDGSDPRAQSGAVRTTSSTVTIHRAVFLRPKKNAMFPQSSVLAAEDITVVHHERAGLELSGGTASLTRARFEAAIGERCGSREAAAIRSSSGHLILASIATTSTTAPSVYLENDEDTQIAQVTRSRFQRFEGCGGEAVFVRGNWSAVFDSVELSSEDGTALTVATIAAFELSASRIVDSDVGIAVATPIDPFHLVDGTAFVNTRRPYVTAIAR